MKKLLLSISLLTILACGGNDFKVYSLKQKKELLHNVYVKENPKALNKYNEIMGTLLIALEKGNETAKREIDEWSAVELETNLDRKTVDVSGQDANVLRGWPQK